MFNAQNQVFVSSPNYEYHNLDVKEIAKDKTKHFALSLHTGYNTFNTVPIIDVLTSLYNGPMFEITVKNPCETTHTVQCTPEAEFFTKRGYISAQKISDNDVLFDSEGRLCKITRKKFLKNQTVEVYTLKTQYNNNYLCNNILVRSILDQQ